jgi:methyl-accepting chemotaxis protein
MWKRLGLQQLLAIGFGLLLVVATVIGSLSIQGSLSVERSNLQVARDARRVQLAERLVMLQQRQQATSRAYFLLPSADALARYREAAHGLESGFEELRELSGDSKESELLEIAKATTDQGNTELEVMLSLEKDGRHPDVLAELKNSVAISAQIRKSLDNYGAYVIRVSSQRQAAQQVSIHRAIWISSAVLGLAFLLAVADAWITIRVVNSRVRLAQGAMDAIAQKDLSRKQIEVHTDDSLGRALTAVNQMSRSLTGVVGELEQIAEQVAAAATQIAATARSAAGVADSQKSEAATFAAALSQTAAVITQIAEHASAVSLAAGRAAASARQGDEAVSATVVKMNQIADESSMVAGSIDALARTSEEIGTAATLIQEIAGQTNLLALNAAIEAARAGEHGKGFSVVAVEVRRLAERTASATVGIEGMVATVRKKIENTLEKTRMAQSRITEGVALAAATRKSLGHIQSSVDEVEAMTSQIAAATTEQSATTVGLQENLGRILQMVATSTQAAHESSEACGELSQLSERMRQQLSTFVLPAA